MTLTAEQIAALEHWGYPAPRSARLRTTCPHCSDDREKWWERCVKIRVQSSGLALSCYHCDAEQWIEV
jgi:hypothetical protein